jgi:hypothetical protein
MTDVEKPVETGASGDPRDTGPVRGCNGHSIDFLRSEELLQGNIAGDNNNNDAQALWTRLRVQVPCYRTSLFRR